MSKKHFGLTDAEVKESLNSFGSNALEKTKKRSLFQRFLANLSDPIIKILLIALALEVVFTFGKCNLFEVFGIVAAILIATLVSTFSEYGSEAAFEKMQRESLSSRAKVIRCGTTLEISPDDIVVGDILTVSRGDMVYADCKVLEGEVTVDQSALNGENVEVRKAPSKSDILDLSDSSSVFRGSIVTEGEGVLKVMRVGAKTFYGMVAKDVQAETRESPLRLRLERLAAVISKIGYVIAFLVGFIYLYSAFVVDNGFVLENIKSSLSDRIFVFSTLIKALTLMITVVVVAVPEGLPMMITVVLTANMRRMIKDNILVKKLVGIETSGSLNVLFTDKTGTLTKGHLSLDRIITYNGIAKAKGAIKRTEKIYESLLLSSYYNTSCTLSADKTAIGGNSTDRALMSFFKDEDPPRKVICDKVDFSSERKLSSVTFDSGVRLVKGAPEIIMSMSGSVVNEKGEKLISDFSFIKREYRNAVSKGERVIAIAEGNPEEGYSLICLVVLKDQIREGAKDAVRTIKNAGIRIVMVTGDNKDTAISIAEEVGIFNKDSNDIAITSEELSQLSDGEVKKILPRISVVSRALPQDKTRLVRLSLDLDLVVGMTGDGINDAPSLKLADVGFSMGSGTDIAKSSGDIVILDDSLNAICKAILYGRTIFKSIKKFITFQLIMNLAACGITLIGRFIGVEAPITIIQMLWVNIIMDTLGGIAFSGESPMNYYMNEKPKKRDEPILSKDVVSKVIFNGSYTLVLLVIFLTSSFFTGLFPILSRRLAAFYALFIFAGLFNCLSSRSERLFIFHGLFKNKLFLLILSFISAVQILIIYFGGELFRSTPLHLIELIIVVLLASSVLVFDGIRRFFVKLK